MCFFTLSANGTNIWIPIMERIFTLPATKFPLYLPNSSCTFFLFAICGLRIYLTSESKESETRPICVSCVQKSSPSYLNVWTLSQFRFDKLDSEIIIRSQKHKKVMDLTWIWPQSTFLVNNLEPKRLLFCSNYDSHIYRNSCLLEISKHIKKYFQRWQDVS